ncbi:efflux RND transporter periplasmic adaptor subunit [Erythrobacter sp. sf7]|uniref:Efflux RND transporter periplasmic adaptor subunit n=1 Tax=Erythrobacter fulvus TaxID=2987523 RepID=A0ABT5JQ31_9SPHN|nr:efflux RND transporter periplasmic adaptor subunit [Erythrobacter fulvus]MDC8754626.1 efflux RND transporter periplasmic adaptor subunit [Erythrobacter fulvus]
MMLHRISRWRWPLILAAIVVAGLGFAFWPQAVEVDAGTVSRGPMVISVTDNAVTRAQEHYVVSAPVTGYLSRIALKAGDNVQRGQEIARVSGRPSSPLDPRSIAETRAALAAARAAADQARAGLDLARSDLARAEALAPRQFISRAQLEAVRARVIVGEAAVAQARADAARLSAMLARPDGATGSPVTLHAPASGRVLSVLNESGGVVLEGAPIITIGDPALLEVVVDLLSREAVQVQPGDRAEITRWGGPEPLVGTVWRVEPFGRLQISALGVEEQRVNVIIRFADPARLAAAGLGHGFQVDATIERWRNDKALRVPVGALLRGSEGQWQVYVIDGGRARLTDVTIGQINEDWGEVRAGLAESQQVILNPASMVHDGQRVRPRAGASGD